MVLKNTLLAVAVAAILPAVHATGINCNGSSNCGKWQMQANFYSVAARLDPNRSYGNGEHIICALHTAAGTDHGGYCLFLQNTGYGAYGSAIRPLIKALMDHGCDTCGSVPYFYPRGNNDPSYGILTLNWVSDVFGCENGRDNSAVIC